MLAWNKIYHLDVLEGLQQIDDEAADVVLVDPPYNIGVNFGNNKCKKSIDEYVSWSKEWLAECKRILKPSGTLFVYGFSEVLAHLSVNLDMNQRWLIWHYTNKSVAAAKFWQRSHESILVGWKDTKERIFNLDDVREPYTQTFLKNAAGKERKPTKGRFSQNLKQKKIESDEEYSARVAARVNKTTIYKAHKNGALPRDVLKISALAGGAGLKSRIYFCKDCGVSFVGKKALVAHPKRYFCKDCNISFEEKKELHDHAEHQIENHEIIKHPTQKPFDLTTKLLMSCKPPEAGKVVIPFAGSGSEILVAKNLNLDVIGLDKNLEYVIMGNSLINKGAAHVIA